MTDPSPLTQDQRREVVARMLPYIVPFVVMVALTALADALPQFRAHLYILRVLLVGALAAYYWRRYTELGPVTAGGAAWAALIGLAIIALWIALDPYYPQSLDELRMLATQGFQALPHTEKIAGQFNPFAPGAGLPPGLLIAARVLGAVLVVPVVEEVFHRGWLLRYLIREDFQRVPLGTFTWGSFLISTALFGLSHHEWLAGLLCGAALNGFLYWKRSLTLCIIAHAAANLGLAAWVLGQGAWQFW